MPGLEDFYEGLPITPDPLQAIVNRVENLLERSAHVMWWRRWGGQDRKTYTRDGDNVEIVGMTTQLNNYTLKPDSTDLNIPVNFPMKFARPPAVIAMPITNKPVMVSVFAIDTNSCTLSVRTVGSVTQNIEVTGVTCILIGPRASSQ